jgi:hypothetical protein
MITNSNVARVFRDLENYRNFCRDYGYRFDESDLYRRNTPYNQFDKLRRGEYVKNNWDVDAAAYAESNHRTSN